MTAAAMQSGGGAAFTAILAAFAAVGIYTLIATAARYVRGDDRRNEDMARTLLAATNDAVAIVEDGDQLVDGNAPYLRLCRSGEGQAPTPERFLSRIPGSQDAMGSLLRAIADGSPSLQTFPFDAEPDGRRLVVSVHPLEGARRVLWVISLGDEGGKRGGVSALSQTAPGAAGASAGAAAHLPVSRAIPERASWGGDAVASAGDAGAALTRLWELAPVGMLLLSKEGAALPNGTFARWLGYDLADLGVSGVPFGEMFDPQSTPAVLKALARGESGAAGLDVDLIRRDGATWEGHMWIGGRPGEACVAVVVPRMAVARDVVSAVPADTAVPAMGKMTEGAFFSRSPLAMASVDRAGGVTEANGSFARLFAGSGGSVIGGTLESLVVERDAAPVARMLGETLAGQSPVQPVDVAIAGEGGRSARLYAAMLGHGGAGIAVYAVDTTAQRALEAQFAQSQKMQAIGQLAGGVAHDFNNVLTAILGYCDLLLANHRPSDPSFPDIMQIKQNANRAAGLVRQLLAFSRRQTLRPQVIQLTDVISDLSMLMRRLIGESIPLQVEHGRDLWPVRVDVNQLEQVIVNLAVNARDAMPDGGVLTLRTSNVTAADCARYADSSLLPADYVLVEVQDTGTGIAPDIMDKIFEPFFSTKDVGKGTGLGLSTVYGIVKQTGGSIQAASEVGQGTIFRVFLPRHEVSVDDIVPPVPEQEAKPSDLTGHGTVLLVEDEDAVRAFAARALSARGYKVITAASGIEALQAIEETDTAIDLVVSDVVMPEMDGPSLLRELRARHSKVKVIFISGYAEEAFAKNLPEGEKFAFLPKPFSLKQLLAAVKEAIGS
ncbi:MAG: hypothetical protein B7Z15_01595 [Rhizobiales bacterium 32-66-8]|nr:MAG: hypothetical protein B7Z15_01595 [Rhizobiales bacterium 32-66-8]